MLKNQRHFIFAVLLAFSLSTEAQETTSTPDRFGQPVTALGEAAARSADAPPRRVIKNDVSDPRTIRDDIVPGDDKAGSGERKSNTEVREQKAKAAPNEFQKFIFESTGTLLPLYGADFFLNNASTYAPIANAPVPSEYTLGPGDELLIRGWGSIDIDLRAKIDRNGLISIPTVGSIVLGGVRAGEAQDVVRAAIAKLYKGVTVNVNFGQLRAITVYLVGQARKPGTYTVSSLSTLVTALFASGGPSATGSLRRVQVKRGGKVVTELDLYAFIAKGDKTADIKLQDGDSIYIPAATGYIALTGTVNTPAIYELKGSGDTIGSVLEIAGGMPVVADPRRVTLERIDPKVSRPRSVEQFALDNAGLGRVLKSGDVLGVVAIKPEFSNAVTLRGNVEHPLRTPFVSGMRISDLIPSRDFLVTRKAIQRQNGAAIIDAQDEAISLAQRVGTASDTVNWDYAVVERLNRSNLSVDLIPFNLGKVLANPAHQDNLELQPGDTVTIFSQEDVAVPVDKRKVFVRVEGEVNLPGIYQMNAGETLQSLMARAGGPTSNAYLFGAEFYRDDVRKAQEVNLKKLADRLEDRINAESAKLASNARISTPGEAAAAEARRTAQAAAANDSLNRLRRLKPSGRLALGLPPNERSFASLPGLKLLNGDHFVVPARPDFVHVFGSVNSESSALWKPNSRVSDYLKSAGVNAEADVDHVFVVRADGSVAASNTDGWVFKSVNGLIVMPGDTIVVPVKIDQETAWTKFFQGARDWTQIFANLGLGAAAIKSLSN